MSELTARSRSRSPPAGADVNLKCAECLDAHVETGSAFEKFSKNKKARVLLPQKTIIRNDDGSAFAFRAVSPPLDEVFASLEDQDLDRRLAAAERAAHAAVSESDDSRLAFIDSILEVHAEKVRMLANTMKASELDEGTPDDMETRLAALVASGHPGSFTTERIKARMTALAAAGFEERPSSWWWTATTSMRSGCTGWRRGCPRQLSR